MFIFFNSLITKGPLPWSHGVLSAWDAYGNEQSKDHEQPRNRGYDIQERLHLCAFQMQR